MTYQFCSKLIGLSSASVLAMKLDIVQSCLNSLIVFVERPQTHTPAQNNTHLELYTIDSEGQSSIANGVFHSLGYSKVFWVFGSRSRETSASRRLAEVSRLRLPPENLLFPFAGFERECWRNV